jgi:hypothetical protein
MKWNLTPLETAGVIGVGLVLGLGTSAAANQVQAPQAHNLAMLAGGAALYTIGVVIGTNRPPQGWQIPTTKQITG